jgi:hypothetical protein
MHLTARFGSRLLAALLTVGFWLVPSHAAAQTVELVDTASIDRDVDVSGREDTERYAISYGDCVADDHYYFRLRLTGYSGYQLEVWAGSTDCTANLDVRRGTSPQCWLVYSEDPSQDRVTVEVAARDIVAQNKVTDEPNGPGSGTLEDCNSGIDGQGFTLYFILATNSGEVASSVAAQFESTFDLVGPAPPTDLEVGVGERRLMLSWEASTADDVQGYRFYCVPAGEMDTTSTGGASAAGGNGGSGGTAPGGAGAGANAGAAGATGTGGSVAETPSEATGGNGEATVNADCPTNLLIAGEPPPTDARYACGSVAGGRERDSGSTNATLENGTTYAVAVAAVDELDSVGLLSEVECGTPMEIDDFFEVYRRAGGKGGGGFCSITARGTSAFALLLAAGLGAWWMRRRARLHEAAKIRSRS